MKTFTKCIYKNEMQCKIGMQVKMSKLSLGKSYNQKMKNTKSKLKLS
jgi:hypothetical protein